MGLMRLSPRSIDLTAFRAFVEGAGGQFEQPKDGCAEILRFSVGKARGSVSQRQSGKLTFSGYAEDLCRQFRQSGNHNAE
jgi:hypothetical protein